MLNKLLNFLTKPSTSVEILEEYPFNKNEVFPDSWFNYAPILKGSISEYNGFISTYRMGITNALDWINQVCQNFNINPRLILSLLEKHKLITDSKPVATETMNSVMGIGTGASMRLGFSPGLKQALTFEGFDKQIYHCAKNHKRWFDLAGRKINTKINCTDGEVYPKNAFTYALYMCDPYIGTNDLYKKTVVEDKNRNAIEDHVKVDVKKFLFIPYKKVITKVIKQDTKLVRKAPFGVYQTWQLWSKLFKS